MKATILENNAVQSPAAQLARLSGPHGYRFDGDAVHLNAMFALLDAAAHERSWALQLWACPSAPASAAGLAGHKVAEVALPPMGELADEIEHFEVTAFAWPPAGSGAYTMVLVLAAGRPGQFNDIHDFSVYSRPEQFVQPRLNGTVGYRIDGQNVQISVERVENTRDAANRSGTLSLELWALPARFEGGAFEGHHLAGVEIGSLNGQNELALQPIDLAFTPPPAGAWNIVLMLREWTVDGFVTRDFANFATPFVVEPVIASAPAPVVEQPAVALVETMMALVLEKAPEPVAAQTPAPVVEKAPPVVAKASEPVVVKTAPPVAAKQPAAVVTKPVAPVATPKASTKGVSVNSARVEELAAVEGLNKKLAEGIVKKRPFSSIEDLREVKGLGAKILAKVRSSLRL